MAKSRGHRHSRRTTGTTQKPRSTTRTFPVPQPKRQPRGSVRRTGRHRHETAARTPPTDADVPIPTQGHQRSPSRGGLKRHRQQRVRGRAVRHDTGTSGHSNAHRLPGTARPTNSAEPPLGYQSVVSQSVTTVRFAACCGLDRDGLAAFIGRRGIRNSGGVWAACYAPHGVPRHGQSPR
jgi:hypothetical protein